MKMKSISLAAALALASTAVLAQGSPQQSGPASKTPAGEDMNGAAKKDGAGATTGASRPSPKDPSTQGAGTAGAADKKGDATTPGGTMKK